MNHFTLTGRLVRDVEVKTSEKGITVARFTLACKRVKGDNPDFINIVTFGKLAEICAKNIKQGVLVLVEGNIQTGTYEKDGKKHQSINFVGNRVEFLSFPKSDAPVSDSDVDGIYEGGAEEFGEAIQVFDDEADLPF